MKDKDPNEEEFNQDEQDNINEADDSFGLPDLDFDTLEEAGEGEEKETEEPAEAAEQGTEDTDTEAETSEEPEVEEVAAEAEEQEEEAEEQATEAAAENSDEVVADGAEAVAEPEEEAPPRTYVPPKPESNAPKMIAIILAVIVVSVGVWYFMFYRPQAQAAEKQRIEAENRKKAEDERKAALAKKQEEERQKAEEATNKAADEDESASTAAGTFSTISVPTGRYYIIVESFVDGDMAADYGNKLAAEGVSTTLLAPLEGKKKLHRLALGDYDSYVEAQEAANKLKSEFGETLWVLKY